MDGCLGMIVSNLKIKLHDSYSVRLIFLSVFVDYLYVCVESSSLLFPEETVELVAKLVPPP